MSFLLHKKLVTKDDIRSNIVYQYLKDNGPMTVPELIQSIAISDNSIRIAIGLLEAEGLIEVVGTKHNTRGAAIKVWHVNTNQ